ncbi:hypothetical protein [Nocardioides sp. J54]|uniref:hypothetical protein n=1 Tax=Nocardioides sp. J54 TaxID=935866 RepID=UPI00048A6F9F|nr:hypothetical protein [Nocardioides sp. J54]
MPVTPPRALRAGLGAACGAALLALAAAPADAGAPTRIDAEYWGASCVADLGDGHTLFLVGGGATDGSEGGVSAFVEDADGGLVAQGEATELTFGSSFAATVPLDDGHTFAVAADAAPGETTTEQVDERDGNRWTKGTSTSTEVTLSGTTASYDGAPVELASNACTADITGFHVRSNNPAAHVSTWHDFGSDICAVPGLPDGEVRLSGQLPDVVVEVVLDHGEAGAEKAQGTLRMPSGRGTLHTDVVDLFTGETSTRASIGVTLQQAGTKQREVGVEEGATQRQTVTPYLATIDVVLADGRRGTATCAAAAVTTQVRLTPAR